LAYKNSIRIYQIGEIARSFWLGMFISVIFFKLIGMNDFSLQKRIKDEVRASVFSVGSMFTSFGFRISLVGVSLTLGLMSYASSIIVFGAGFGIIAIIISIFLIRA
jgi:predicted ABC-type exoprotein transport system permease subunit